jgi:hypothetical protein
MKNKSETQSSTDLKCKVKPGVDVLGCSRPWQLGRKLEQCLVENNKVVL